MSKRISNDDLVAAGFHRVENVKNHAPKIKWGDLHKKSPPDTRASYAERLASAMNHAAHLIQGERDELGRLCEQKEKQIQSLKAAYQQNNNMVETQITKHNEERQLYNAEIAKLKARIRELENGDNA